MEYNESTNLCKRKTGVRNWFAVGVRNLFRWQLEYGIYSVSSWSTEFIPLAVGVRNLFRWQLEYGIYSVANLTE